LIDRLLYLLVAGGIGGLLAWLVSEPFAPGEILPHGIDPSDPKWSDLYHRWIFFQNLFGVSAGLFIGGLIGLAGGWSQGSRKQMKNGLLWGAVAGAVAGGVAVWIASYVYDLILTGTEGGRQTLFGGVLGLIARAVGWGIFGVLLGAGQAIATRSWQRVRQAALGGLIGGTLGGVAFELIAPFTAAISMLTEPGRAEIGRFSRAAGLVCIGAGVGLFIGLIEMLLRTAWVRVLAGRNEGKEYLVDAPVTTIGRSELADIRLFGDKTVEREHAQIQRAGREYVLVDSGAPSHTWVNGQAIKQTPLADGDVIQIGQFNLEFRLKAGRGVRAPVDVRRAPVPGPPPTAANVCPFCGQIKDAAGNCACTVAPAAPVAPQQPVPAPAAGFTLVVLDGPMAGQRFPIGDAVVPMGREALGGVQIAHDSLASRRHAQIQVEAGQLVISDVGSTNGTFVNGVRVTRQVLAKGDTVAIGSTNFRVE
jgi:pSer/pThr/pTyr-binding forkhead associated (FHA) protein